MAEKNLTPYYSLSQFTDASSPSWLVDYNDDMIKIDAELNTFISRANAAANSAAASENSANIAVANAQAAATSASTAISTANNAVGVAASAVDIANDVVTTANDAFGKADSAERTAASAAENATRAVTSVNEKLPLAGGTVRGNLTVGGQFSTKNHMFFYDGSANTGSIVCDISGNTFNMGNGWFNFGRFVAGSQPIEDGTVNCGVVRCRTTDQWSSRTIKENIQPIDGAASAKLLQVEPVTFNYKSSGDKSMGFIAQDFKKIYPELVSMTDKNDENSYGIQYSALVAPLVALCQKQQAEIDQLKSDMVAAKQRLGLAEA